MRITCPQCEASYDVPDRMIGAGRTVRCKRCAGTWAVEPEAALVGAAAGGDAFPPHAAAHPPAPDVTDEDDHAPPPVPGGMATPDRLAPSVPPPAPVRATRLTYAAWALSVGVLAGAASGAIVARDGIRRAWPATARAYALAGFPPALAPPASAPPASVPEVTQPVQDH